MGTKTEMRVNISLEKRRPKGMLKEKNNLSIQWVGKKNKHHGQN